MKPVRKTKPIYTVADYLAWPDDDLAIGEL